jgi:hypothetical protein
MMVASDLQAEAAKANIALAEVGDPTGL